MPGLVDVSHAKRKGSSVGLIVLKKVLQKLGIDEEGIVGSYETAGQIYLRKME
jgi:hypothetical protein